MNLQGINTFLVADIKDAETIPNVLFNNLQNAIDSASQNGFVISFMNEEPYIAREGISVVFLKQLVAISVESLASYEHIGRKKIDGSYYLGGIKTPRYLLFKLYQGVAGSPVITYLEDNLDEIITEVSASRLSAGQYFLENPAFVVDGNTKIILVPQNIYDESTGEILGTVGFDRGYSQINFGLCLTVADLTGTPSDSLITEAREVILKLEIYTEGSVLITD